MMPQTDFQTGHVQACLLPSGALAGALPGAAEGEPRRWPVCYGGCPFAAHGCLHAARHAEKVRGLQFLETLAAEATIISQLLQLIPGQGHAGYGLPWSMLPAF